MKLIKREETNFVFHVGKREKRLLFDVLKLYPLVPAAHHRVSKASDTKRIEECQKLLEEALAERRGENKKQLLAMLNEQQRFQETDSGHRLTLSGAQIEWLLQVLNDIRVGSWLVLGEPDEKHGKPIELNTKNVRYYAAMEFGGLFQTILLEALHERP